MGVIINTIRQSECASKLGIETNDSAEQRARCEALYWPPKAGSSFFPTATFHEPFSVLVPSPTHVDKQYPPGSHLQPDSDYWCEARNTRSAHVRSRSLLAKDGTLAAAAAA